MRVSRKCGDVTADRVCEVVRLCQYCHVSGIFDPVDRRYWCELLPLFVVDLERVCETQRVQQDLPVVEGRAQVGVEDPERVWGRGVQEAPDGRAAVRVPLREGRTLHHDIEGRWGAGKVVMRTAPQGPGIIAGGPCRAVFEMLGVADVVAKSTGSQNPYNMVRATFDGLQRELSPRQVAARRGKKVAEILPARDGGAAAPAEATAE